MIFVGIDWADDHHDVSVADPEGQRLWDGRIAHSREGLELVRTRLLDLNLGSPASDIVCVVETNRGLLVHFLLESGFRVCPINPKTSDARRKPSGAKTDRIDARILAEIGRQEWRTIRTLTPNSDLVAELKQLTADQDGLITEATRLSNQLQANLKAYFPAALNFFSDVTCLASLALLQNWPTLTAIRQASEDDLVALLKSHNHSKPEKAAKKIRAIVQAPQLDPGEITERTKSRLMLVLVGQMLPLREAIVAYDKEIWRVFKLHSDSELFNSLPGAGKRLAPRLLAEWGDDRSRYANYRSVQALAGTSPVLFQSGKYRRARMRYSCIKSFRRTMQLYAFVSLGTEKWAREYYDRKRADGKTHQVALRSLANQWIRIIFGMWRSGSLYDPERFQQAREAHAA